MNKTNQLHNYFLFFMLGLSIGFTIAAALGAGILEETIRQNIDRLETEFTKSYIKTIDKNSVMVNLTLTLNFTGET